MVALFESLGLPEILLILAVVLLLFGAKKLPEMARSLGRSSTEFKKGLKEGHTDEQAEPRALEPGTPAPTQAQAARPAQTTAPTERPAE
jgi:sec-independent protein translocase protein TatA